MARPGKVSGGSRRGRTPADEKRPERPRQYQYLVLIVCEDECTERLYFETAFPHLPDDTVYVHPVGTGRDPLGVAEQALMERASLKARFNRDVDQVWLVFDKDDADKDLGKEKRFHQAIDLAGHENLQLAFSNEVFELWLVLHFHDVDATTPLPRLTVYQMLDVALRQHALFAETGYHHKKTEQHKQSDPSEVLQVVRELGDESVAHARAEELLKAHGDCALLATNPSTRVHLLLQNLRGWIEYHNY